MATKLVLGPPLAALHKRRQHLIASHQALAVTRPVLVVVTKRADAALDNPSAHVVGFQLPAGHGPDSAHALDNGDIFDRGRALAERRGEAMLGAPVVARCEVQDGGDEMRRRGLVVGRECLNDVAGTRAWGVASAWTTGSGLSQSGSNARRRWLLWRHNRDKTEGVCAPCTDGIVQSVYFRNCALVHRLDLIPRAAEHSE